MLLFCKIIWLISFLFECSVYFNKLFRILGRKFFYFLDQNSRILATGGASQNMEILQVLSDIFHCPVYTIADTANSACLGGIYRAKHAISGQTFEEAVKSAAAYKLISSPNTETYTTYDMLCARYEKLEKLLA